MMHLITRTLSMYVLMTKSNVSVLDCIIVSYIFCSFVCFVFFFFFSSRRRHTRWTGDWSSDVCSSDLAVHIFFNEVRDDLRIGLRDELVALFFELLLEFDVVLHDTVVNDDDFSLAVAVRMRVFFGRAAMCSPARVSQAINAVDRIVSDGILEIRQLAGGSTNLHMSVLTHHGDARGVVSAVFETAKAIQDQGYDFLRADISNNAAHGDVS